MKNKLIRQGDVMLIPVTDKALISSLKQDNSACKNEVTIALGEATGHHHTAYNAMPTGEPSCRLVEIDGRRFLDVGTDYFLRHQEHHEHRIVPGLYEITIEKEYCPFEKAMKRVVD